MANPYRASADQRLPDVLICAGLDPSGGFGAKIVGEKVYDLPPGARNTDSGYQQVQSQIPMEMQAAPEHDVVWVINTDEGFGDYVAYRTYLPRPVVGTQGLQAIAWDSSYTEYGAMHFQNGLPKLAKRRPVERDYTAWLGGRALTDGIMRSGKTTPPEVKAYLLSDAFKLEGFKGQAMSFRTTLPDVTSSWSLNSRGRIPSGCSWIVASTCSTKGRSTWPPLAKKRCK
jgi:ABC transporter substrate binding protein (PQQ-dependent alcohol dehydrogenase system)